MKRRTSLQAEVLASLAIVMFAATGVLTLLIGFSLTNTHQLQQERLSQWLVNALLVEARAPHVEGISVAPGSLWWRVAEDGSFQSLGAVRQPADAGAREIVAAVREQNRTLFSEGSPWQPLYFATFVPGKNVIMVARLPASDGASRLFASRTFLVWLLIADVAVFVGFGFFLLRRRVVAPLQNLAGAARTVADGALDARVPEEGALETVEVAQAFNEMTAALQKRTAALEEAIGSLSRTNDELRTARAGLERAERLAAVGELAAGVAHEVGNPIGALLAYLDVARRDPGISEATQGQLERAGREGERVRRILRQLLDFSRPASHQTVAVDVAAVVREMAELIQTQERFAGGSIRVKEEGEVPNALADPALVSQIVLNLLANAADAVAGVEAPSISIRIRQCRDADVQTEIGEDGAMQVRSRDLVECEISDNGPGIPEETRERIFDLFFTTKDPGRGTGLGLANAARHAEQMQGQLELADSDSGTCFVLRLPVV